MHLVFGVFTTDLRVSTREGGEGDPDDLGIERTSHPVNQAEITCPSKHQKHISDM